MNESRRRRAAAWALTLGAAALAGGAAAAERPLAMRLADLGPRPVGSAAHATAVDLLMEALAAAGLQQVEARLVTLPLALADPHALAAEVPPVSENAQASESKSLQLLNLTGVLPGPDRQEIVLSAHYDTVPGSPGAGDDASGCGAIIAAVADLARTPLRHTVRVVLFDGEEAGLLGSKAWVESLSPEERARILAVINVEGVGWAGSAGPVVHSFPVRRSGERRVAPGWLVHAALRGAANADFPLRMVDPWLSLPAQLLVRSSRLRFGADSDSFLAAGVPALFVSDGSFVTFDPAYHQPIDSAERLDAARLERWSATVAAIARRLDGLDGRPLDEDQYLVAFGRVWLRRDLLWLCFGAWAALALVGWRGHRRRGADAPRPSVAEFAFRSLFLLSSFVTPVFTAALLGPPVLLSLWRPASRVARYGVVAAGLAPAAILLALTLLAFRRGFTGAWELGLPATLLLVAVLGAFAASLLRRPATPPSA